MIGITIYTEKPVHKIPYVDDDGNTLAVFHGCPLTPSESAKILKKNTSTRWEAPSKRKEKQRFEEIDYIQLTLDRIAGTITGWEGIEDQHGKEFPFSKQNLVVLFENNSKLVNNIMEQFDEIGEKIEKQKEEEIKNSLNSQDNL